MLVVGVAKPQYLKHKHYPQNSTIHRHLLKGTDQSEPLSHFVAGMEIVLQKEFKVHFVKTIRCAARSRSSINTFRLRLCITKLCSLSQSLSAASRQKIVCQSKDRPHELIVNELTSHGAISWSICFLIISKALNAHHGPIGKNTSLINCFANCTT